jgi:hypothetical protein
LTRRNFLQRIEGAILDRIISLENLIYVLTGGIFSIVASFANPLLYFGVAYYRWFDEANSFAAWLYIVTTLALILFGRCLGPKVGFAMFVTWVVSMVACIFLRESLALPGNSYEIEALQRYWKYTYVLCCGYCSLVLQSGWALLYENDKESQRRLLVVGET